MHKSLPPLLLVLAVAFLAVNFLTLEDGHLWGDDFAQYLRHAKNMVEHKPYASAVMLDTDWGVAPPLFPALLAPLVKSFGLNFKILKIWNLIFWLGYCAVLGLLAAGRLGKNIGALIFLFLLSSPYFFIFKQNILTDIPFLFFFTLSIYFIDRENAAPGQAPSPAKAHPYFILGVSAILCALLTRLAGITLVTAAVVYFAWNKQDIKKSASALVLSAIAYLFMSQLGVTISAPLTAIGSQPASLLTQAYLNCFSVIEIFLTFVFPSPSPLSEIMLKYIGPFVSELTPAVLLTATAVVLFRLAHRKISFLLLASAIYFSMIAFWPAMEERYVLPLIGPALVLLLTLSKKASAAAEGRIRHVSRWAKSLLIGVLVILILNNLLVITKDFNHRVDGLDQPANRALFAWVKENTAADSRFMFRHPRLFWLMTDRPAAAYYLNWNDVENIPSRAQWHQINYFVLEKRRDMHLRAKFSAAEFSPSLVWENDNFLVYQIQR